MRGGVDQTRGGGYRRRGDVDLTSVDVDRILAALGECVWLVVQRVSSSAERTEMATQRSKQAISHVSMAIRRDSILARHREQGISRDQMAV